MAGWNLGDGSGIWSVWGSGVMRRTERREGEREREREREADVPPTPHFVCWCVLWRLCVCVCVCVGSVAHLCAYVCLFEVVCPSSLRLPVMSPLWWPAPHPSPRHVHRRWTRSRLALIPSTVLSTFPRTSPSFSSTGGRSCKARCSTTTSTWGTTPTSPAFLSR